MEEIPKNLRYTAHHEWVRLEDDEEVVTMGITYHAQEMLGDITYLELPQEGTEVSREDVIGQIESVKATADIFSAVSGTVLEVNTDLVDSPEVINEDPHNEGWMLKIRVDDIAEYETLMNAKEYKDFIESEASEG